MGPPWVGTTHLLLLAHGEVDGLPVGLGLALHGVEAARGAAVRHLALQLFSAPLRLVPLLGPGLALLCLRCPARRVCATRDKRVSNRLLTRHCYKTRVATLFQFQNSLTFPGFPDQNVPNSLTFIELYPCKIRYVPIIRPDFIKTNYRPCYLS